ncbi:hypothetical protein WS87_22775 [Burkholderia sp. MSMB0856]|nr:hypothetical protein WS87_22775 [Burkholderia sp. MSMB0856]KVH34365.1 hypothetical protein WS87_19095 [Burkholderia sp. MSMB0856]
MIVPGIFLDVEALSLRLSIGTIPDPLFTNEHFTAIRRSNPPLTWSLIKYYSLELDFRQSVSINDSVRKVLHLQLSFVGALLHHDIICAQDGALSGIVRTHQHYYLIKCNLNRLSANGAEILDD